MTDKDVLLAASNHLRCVACGVEEYVFPLDDQPIDASFAATYLCEECEEIAEVMHLASRSIVTTARAI